MYLFQEETLKKQYVRVGRKDGRFAQVEGIPEAGEPPILGTLHSHPDRGCIPCCPQDGPQERILTTAAEPAYSTDQKTFSYAAATDATPG